MKITISPTEPQERVTDSVLDDVQHAATLEHPFDNIDCNDAMLLLARALVAYGYHPNAVRECLNEELGGGL